MLREPLGVKGTAVRPFADFEMSGECILDPFVIRGIPRILRAPSLSLGVVGWRELMWSTSRSQWCKEQTGALPNWGPAHFP